MVFSRASVAVLVMFLLAVHAADAHQHMGVEAGVGRSLLGAIDCSSECARRCRLSSRPNLCNRACGTCCYRCNCVPPGYAGNKEACPCYARMTAQGGRPKCP